MLNSKSVFTDYDAYCAEESYIIVEHGKAAQEDYRAIDRLGLLFSIVPVAIDNVWLKFYATPDYNSLVQITPNSVQIY